MRQKKVTPAAPQEVTHSPTTQTHTNGELKQAEAVTDEITKVLSKGKKKKQVKSEPKYWTCLNRIAIGGDGCRCYHNVKPRKVSTNPDVLDRPARCDSEGVPLRRSKKGK